VNRPNIHQEGCGEDSAIWDYCNCAVEELVRLDGLLRIQTDLNVDLQVRAEEQQREIDRLRATWGYLPAVQLLKAEVERLRAERNEWRRVAPNSEAWVKLEQENERLRAELDEALAGSIGD
jgi:hypothetical protein